MILDHSYNLTFSTGKVIAGRLGLETGLTAIVGANGKGKSVSIDTVKANLFGFKLLRGTSDDYKSVDVTTTFQVKGQTYTVARKGNKATLHNGGTEPLASGTKAVNAAIRKLFGYGPDVFEVANFIGQNEIEKFIAMKPTARKELIDQTIGLATLDKLAAWCGEQSNLAAREAATIERFIIEPIEPLKPEGYEPSETVAGHLAKLREMDAERLTLKGWLQNEPKLGEEPVAPCPETAAELQAHQKARQDAAQAVAAAKNKLDAIPAIIMPAEAVAEGKAAWALYYRVQERNRALAGLMAPTMTVEEINALETAWALYDRSQDKKRSLGNMQKPTVTRQEIADAEAAWTQYDRWLAKKRLLDEGEHECPSCEHRWPVAADALARYGGVSEVPEPNMSRDRIVYYRSMLDAWDAAEPVRQKYADVPDDVPAPAQSRGTIHTQREFHRLWDASADLRKKYADAPASAPQPDIPEARLRLAEDALARAQEREEAGAVMDAASNAFAAYLDRSGDLSARLRYEAAKATFDTAKEAHDAWMAEKVIKKARYDELETVPDSIDQIEDRLRDARKYEDDYRMYVSRKEDFDRHSATHARLLAEVDQWAKARKSVGVLKLKIKTHLLPSLNKVASSLLWSMSRGAFRYLFVTEDFDITVDGQNIDTMSGSEKAIASLALRIGLGMVLTNRVFPALIGDEIDSACDDDRASAIAEALGTLTNTVKQIVLVSHKPIPCDRSIEIG